MDNKKIEDLLKKAKLPEPSEAARITGIAAALHEFKKNKKNIQGLSFTERLIDKLTHLRRRSMEKKFAFTGAFGLTASIMIMVWATSITVKEPHLTDLRPSTLKTQKSLFTDEKPNKRDLSPSQPEKMVEFFNKKPVTKSDKEYVQSEYKWENAEQLSPAIKSRTNSSIQDEDQKPAEIGKVSSSLQIQDPTHGQDISVEAENSRARQIPTGDKKRSANRLASVKDEFSPLAPKPTVSSGGGQKASLVKKMPKQKILAEGLANSGMLVKESALRRGEARKRIRPDSLMIATIKANVPEYTGRDRFPKVTKNGVKVVSETPVSTFSIDVDTASYSFMRREINHGRLPQKDSVRVEEMINYFDYDYALPEEEDAPFKPTIALWETPWNPKTKLLHIGIKGHEIPVSQKPKSNLVFLIDVSGSMRSHDKLPLLKNSFRMLIESLDPKDVVSIVVYAGAAGTVLEPTPVSQKGKIFEALDRLHAGGSTAGGEGIRQAYALAEANYDKTGINRVILATDGDFNVGIQNVNELKGFVERKRGKGIFLSLLGFGQGNYNDELMQALAQNGNGNAAYIDTLNEARKVLVEEGSSTLFTIAKDVKIQVEFNPARVSEYRLIGYETRKLNREDFNIDKVDAGEVGAGHSVTAIYEITTVAEEGGGLIDKLRYGTGKREMVAENAEYAFLKIRHKSLKSDVSQLITRPITDSDRRTDIEAVPGDLRFASAVAAFGQKLRGGTHLGNFSVKDIIALAQSGKGRDQFGYRQEFINLMKLAQTARVMKSLP